jgi:protein gp37
MNKTSIEWTHRPETGGAAGGFTWNPIRARNKETGKVGTFCTHASPGCLNCYAEAIGKRFGTGLAFNVPNLDKIEFFLDEKILEEPLRRKKPATIFVGDMFDLFHEAIPVEMIAEVLRVAWKLKRHTFQFLTKRAERMQRLVSAAQQKWEVEFDETMWFGVSVESQQYADERIPLLLQTPAAVRFLSVEPMLETVDLDGKRSAGWWKTCPTCDGDMSVPAPGGGKPCPTCWDHQGSIRGIDWVICGGESGPGARPFNLAWAESLLDQCRAAGVPFFMKQVGSRPFYTAGIGTLPPECCIHRDVRQKGGDMSEWPEHLRVREFPAERTVGA